jgi:hypothetical protein
MENATLYDQLCQSVIAHPDDPSARFENKVWTYKAFLHQVEKAARKLRQ